MAWLYGDSYDGYQTAGIAQTYDLVNGASISALHGQCGSQSLKLVQGVSTGYVTKGLAPGDARSIGGAALYFEGEASIMSLSLGAIPTFFMYLAADGSITAYYNPDAAFPPVSFVTPGGLLPLNRLTYFEWDVLLGSGGTGEAAISINGQERYSVTGVSTAWPGEESYTGIRLGGGGQPGADTYYDSLYLLDGTGPAPLNARLGHTGALALLATGAGAHTDFTVTGAGANYLVSAVNTPDPSTRYVSSGTLNAQDSYAYSNVPLISGTTIFCVQTRILAKEDAAGSRELDALVRQGGTDYLSGSPVAVPTTDYAYLIYPMPTNPATSAAWTVNDVNADEFSMEITT